MRDWDAYVRDHLRLPGLTPDRESWIVRDVAAQLDEFHREALEAGLPEAEADLHARRQVGDWERLAQDILLANHRHTRPRLERLTDRLDTRNDGRRRVRILIDMVGDLRIALRHLRQAPGFALAAVLTLALGIGATSAIFSVVNAVVLRPLPYPDAASLVTIVEVLPQFGHFAVAPANFLDWQKQASSFDGMAAFAGGDATITGVGEPDQVAITSVSREFFDVLGVGPARGRTFTAAEDVPGNNAVVVLSHGAWQRRFGGDPGIVGRTIVLDGAPSTIVGVMPADFAFPSTDVELWRPLALNPGSASRGSHYLRVVARIATATPPERAEAEMSVIARRLASQYPDVSGGESATIMTLHEQMVGQVRRALLTLLAAVGVVVLIACANVANLLLVRATARRRELTIRAALGAGRGRLVMQSLMESIALALTGGALGLVFAYLAVGPLEQLSAGSIPRVAEVSIDGRVLGFALVVSLLAGLLFGVVPAWQATRPSLIGTLKDGGRGTTGRSRWARTSLVVIEVALSMVLLVGAALLLRSFGRLTGVDPGFQPDNVLAFRVSLPQSAYPEPARRLAFYDALVARLETLPAARKAALVQTLPLKGDHLHSFTVHGRPIPPRDRRPTANYRTVTPRYFETLGIALLRGRTFSPHDVAQSPLVAIVDEALARQYFPGEDPVGRAIDIGNGSDGFVEIVGLVGSVRYDGLETTPRPTMYVPLAQAASTSMWAVVRADGDPATLSGPVRGVVRELDPLLPVFSMSTLSDIAGASVAQRRFSMLLLTLFAGVAVSLAAIGLYGVVAYGVAQRTKEIGIRIAMGARQRQVLGLVVSGGMRLVLVGVAIGMVAALALSRFIRNLLFEVAPSDPGSYAATAALLVAIAALACYVPARRAMRLDPISALRDE